MMKPVTIRLEDEVKDRLEQQAHGLGHGNLSEYLREILIDISHLDLCEIPTAYRATPWSSVEPPHPIMNLILSREESLPSKNIPSLAHRFLSRRGASTIPASTSAAVATRGREGE